MTDKQVLIERLEKAREAKAAKAGPPKYSMYSKHVVDLPEDDPLSLKTVRGWIKEVQSQISAYRTAWKGGDKKAPAKIAQFQGYKSQLESYLRTGSYVSNFQGANMESKTKFKCISMAYHPSGMPKRTIGVWYPDVRKEWTIEDDDMERAAYKLKPYPHAGRNDKKKKKKE
tara:strand:- start:12435 stop:12947 length:513 start_codon:yes stop_codon:yes gene_type:complete